MIHQGCLWSLELKELLCYQEQEFLQIMEQELLEGEYCREWMQQDS
jgi:hypothetical protein